MTTCTIRAAYARLAATCRATRDIRYYLQGILVEPRAEGGAYIVGTNGHSMIVIIDEKAQCDAPVILAPDRTMLSLLPKVGILDDNDDSKLELTEFRGKPALLLSLFGMKNGHRQHLQLSNPIIEGNFPSWRKVMPNFGALKPGHHSAYNISYVSRALDGFTKVRGAAPAVEIFQEPSDMEKEARHRDTVIACRFVRHENVVLLVMPLRADTSDSLLRTEWLGKAEQARTSKPWAPPAPPAPPAEPSVLAGTDCTTSGAIGQP